MLCGGITATYGLYGQIVGRISEGAAQGRPASSASEQQKTLEHRLGEGQALLGR